MAAQMEIDGGSGCVMASAGTCGSVSVSLHPLVVMNVAEHWTRIRAQDGKPSQGIVIYTRYLLVVVYHAFQKI